MYRFIIADIVFEINLEPGIPIAQNFMPFVYDGERKADCEAFFAPVMCITADDEKIVYADRDNDVAVRKDGTFLRHYFAGYKNRRHFADGFQSSKGSRAEICYLESEKRVLGEINQAFHMIDWEQMMLWHKRLILHASCVETGFGGILFSGISGIGKSTQADLWVRARGARLINGDRVILYQDDGWKASGSPVAGSSQCCLNEQVNVRAIVMLEQSGSNSIRRLKVQEAFRKIYAGTTVYVWDSEYVQKALDLAFALACDIPVYLMACTPDEKAVELLENTLKKENQYEKH